MIDAIRDFLKGKKTYLVCIVGIITAIVGFADGNLSVAQLIEALFIAVGGMTLRAGVRSSSP